MEASILLILFAAGFYFLPSIVAATRHYNNLASILVINIFLGWTVIGWVVALAIENYIQCYPESRK